MFINHNTRLTLLIFFVGFCILQSTAQVQSDTTDIEQKDALRIFLDCSSCDRDYSRRNLPFVNFVRDPADAQVHVYTTSQRMANGGQEYTINFIGKE